MGRFAGHAVVVVRHGQPAVRVPGGHVPKWSLSMGGGGVAEQQKGADTKSLLVSQAHLALLSFKLEINSSQGRTSITAGTEPQYSRFPACSSSRNFF